MHAQRVIGREARQQFMEQNDGKLPDAVIACVGGGSNAIGAFAPFIDDASVQLIGVEPGGEGVETGRHGATLSAGSPGCLHGSISMVLQDSVGQIHEAHSISAGLDYPGVGPQHAYLQAMGRAEYQSATDEEALQAFSWLCRTEGILPALETSHAIAALLRMRGRFAADDVVVLNLSGRGDKDLSHAIEALGARGEAAR